MEKNLFNNELFVELERLKPLHFDETNPTKKQEYKKQIDKLISEITDGHTEFDFEVYFSEVFHAKGGFDVVIANPPYIRFERLEKPLRLFFFKTYFSAVQKCDIFSFFVEKSINLLRVKGVLTFIISSSWLSQHSFYKLRNFILDNTYIKEIIKTQKDTFSAAIDTIILLLQKDIVKHPCKRNLISGEIGSNGKLLHKHIIKQDRYKKQPKQLFILDWSPEQEYIELKLASNVVNLGDITKLSFGIMTGDDSKFTYHTQNHPKADKKVLRGGNIRRYKINWSGEYVWYNPVLMKEHKNTDRPGDRERFESEKIIIKREGAGEIVAAYDNERYQYDWFNFYC